MSDLPYEPKEQQIVYDDKLSNDDSKDLGYIADRYYSEHVVKRGNVKRGKPAFVSTIAAIGLTALLGFGNPGYTAQPAGNYEQFKMQDVVDYKKNKDETDRHEQQLIGYLKDDGLVARIEGKNLRLYAKGELRRLGEQKIVTHFELIKKGKQGSIYAFPYTNDGITVKLADYGINSTDNYQVGAVYLEIPEKGEKGMPKVTFYASRNSNEINRETVKRVEELEKKTAPITEPTKVDEREKTKKMFEYNIEESDVLLFNK